MTLAPGVRLGPYEILAPLGRGGMGEVWRARDARLGRDVAIKSLPAELTGDAERLARFEREARALAALNHPHIAAIYGVETVGENTYLVLECIEGETLAEKLVAGPLPLDEALEVGRQIALALEVAHDAGVIHRDLKPGNVKIRPDGTVKLLDFGLAKIAEARDSALDLTQSPTVTTPATRTGVILGTAAYMSPEQARGKPLDKRTDIFSYGCVLYETLAGRAAFDGETVSDTLAAILKNEPNWSALPPETPQRVRDLLRRCLAKDPARRLHDIADARLEIEEAKTLTEETPIPPQRTRSTRPILWLTLGLLGGIAVAVVAERLLRRPALPFVPSVLRASLRLPEGARLSLVARPTLAFSPDGRTLVFRAREGGVTRLYRRALDGAEAVPIPGTEGGYGPFFSPDGQWLGFFTIDHLKKVALTGGSPVRVCEVPPVTDGGTWTEDGWIVFARTVNDGLYRVRDTGGPVEAFRPPDVSRGEHARLRPQALPGGRGILTTIVQGRDFQDLAAAEVAILAPDGKPHVLVEGGTYARYAAGQLVFARGEGIFTAPLDLSRFELAGPVVPISAPITFFEASGVPHFAISESGSIAFVAGPPVRFGPSKILRIDRTGKETEISVPEGPYSHPRVSPDGRRLVLTRWVHRAGKLFLFDLDRKVLSPLTSEAGRFFCPAWSPDGKRVAFTFFNVKTPRLGVKAADGSGELQYLAAQAADAEFANSWSPDGKLLAYTVAYNETRSPNRLRGTQDIWILPLDGSGPAHPWFETPFSEIAPTFSPDGRRIAYVSDESGRQEVYVRPFPGPGGRIQVSREGGNEPAWSGDQELVFRQGERFLVVTLPAGSEVAAGPPRLLLTAVLDHSSREDNPREYDVDRKTGDLFGIRTAPEPETSRDLVVITNWREGLSRAAR